MNALNWFRLFLGASEFDARIGQATQNYLNARAEWAQGNRIELFDSSDVIAWYLFQASTYAVGRQYIHPETIARIIPLFTKLGNELDFLQPVDGLEERVNRLLTIDKAQPDGTLFEILVALAYRRHRWAVQFEPERPGQARTHDLTVKQRGKHWAVECKRMSRSNYALNEKQKADTLAKALHLYALAKNQSIVMEITFNVELKDIPLDYLEAIAARFIAGHEPILDWEDEISSGFIHNIDWSLARNILATDDVYYGSSRFIELLLYGYDHDWEYSIEAEWLPSAKLPFYAASVSQASVVKWRSESAIALKRKAKHIKSIIANANDQLPPGVPGIIHVGIEASNGRFAEALRHRKNRIELANFDTRASGLRWVYGNYFEPEVTTHENEAWAMTETMVPYRIGRHRWKEPLPGHTLITPEDQTREGVHWN